MRAVSLTISENHQMMRASITWEKDNEDNEGSYEGIQGAHEDMGRLE